MNARCLVLSLLSVAGAARAQVSAPAELSAGITGFSSGYTYRGGALVDSFLAPGVDAQLRLPRRDAWTDHVRFIAGLNAVMPLNREGAAPGIASVARVGADFARVSFSAGVNLRADATPAHLVLLPSLAATVRLSNVALEAGVMDRPVGALARVAASYRGVGVGYLFPLGGEAFARIPLGNAWSLALRAYGFKVLSAFNAGGTVGVVYRWPQNVKAKGAS
ncbi:MAG: hypothetical protein K1X64_01825 [Myxococcaceae bacterium]|nr:hypothetical protein [Myxococcaceae bacterium]